MYVNPDSISCWPPSSQYSRKVYLYKNEFYFGTGFRHKQKNAYSIGTKRTGVLKKVCYLYNPHVIHAWIVITYVIIALVRDSIARPGCLRQRSERASSPSAWLENIAWLPFGRRRLLHAGWLGEEDRRPWQSR